MKEILKKIFEASKEFASIIVFGPRQVDKSTLLSKLFEHIQTITLDDLEIRDYALRDPKGFIKYYQPPVIIDEIQKAPKLLEYIKIEIDKKKSEWMENNQMIELLYILS